MWLLTINGVNHENPCGIMSPQNSGSWGVGFIWLPEDFNVPVYDKPNGVNIGMLTKNSDGNIIMKLKEAESYVEWIDLVFVGHFSRPLIKVYEKKANFMKVFTQSPGLTGWIDLRELKDESDFMHYRVLLSDERKLPEVLEERIKHYNIGVNLPASCLNLRKENTADSELIRCVASTHEKVSGHRHLKILEIKDDWAKAEVTFFEYDSEHDDSGEGCSFKEVDKQTGWLKFVDAGGYPNIWYSVSGY